MSSEIASSLEPAILAAWERRAELGPQSEGEGPQAVAAVLAALDAGQLRVASRAADGAWKVHAWVKQAILLSFRLNPNRVFAGGPQDGEAAYAWWDKVALKTAAWSTEEFAAAAFRAVPGAIVRRGAFIGRDVVLMPSFVNVGAYVGEATMIDTWATVGSCAQIGARCHISGGAGIGGVLEPLQANPVIIEDDCFIGARSEVAEGVIVRQGAVLAMGVFVGASTRIVDRTSGEEFRGEIPAYSVVVPGSLPGRPLPDGTLGPGLACAVIVKRVDAQTRSKTSINELLRA